MKMKIKISDLSTVSDCIASDWTSLQLHCSLYNGCHVDVLAHPRSTQAQKQSNWRPVMYRTSRIAIRALLLVKEG